MTRLQVWALTVVRIKSKNFNLLNWKRREVSSPTHALLSIPRAPTFETSHEHSKLIKSKHKDVNKVIWYISHINSSLTYMGDISIRVFHFPTHFYRSYLKLFYWFFSQFNDLAPRIISSFEIIKLADPGAGGLWGLQTKHKREKK